MELLVAPLQGHTDAAYRHYHAAVYTAADWYVTPFVHMEHGEPRRRDIRDITSGLNDGVPVIPQILFRDVDEFVRLVDGVREAGYNRVNLNLGCPFVPQLKKGRGAAMISNITCMEHVGSIIARDPKMAYSIKMRLGEKDPTEWQGLVDVINDTPLSSVTIHPRIATQQYGGDVNMDEMERFVDCVKHPIIYNGDIVTPHDIDSIAGHFPTLTGVMIGRGLMARPSLIAEWRSGSEWDADLRIETFLDFHDRLFEYYESTLCGPVQILSKIKPMWEYSESVIGHKSFKLIKKATTINAYRDAVASISH